jgi:hypothetical protein
MFAERIPRDEDGSDRVRPPLVISIGLLNGKILSSWTINTSVLDSKECRIFSDDFQICGGSGAPRCSTSLEHHSLDPQLRPLTQQTCATLSGADAFLTHDGAVKIQPSSRLMNLYRPEASAVWTAERKYLSLRCHRHSVSLWTDREERELWIDESATVPVSEAREIVLLASVTRLLSPAPSVSLFLSVTPTGDLLCLSDPALCAAVSRQPSSSLAEQATVFVAISLRNTESPLRRASSSSVGSGTSAAPLFDSLPFFLLFCLAVLSTAVCLLSLLCRRFCCSSPRSSTHRPLEREAGKGEESPGAERASTVTEGMLYDTYPDPEEQSLGDSETDPPVPEQRRPSKMEERRRSVEKVSPEAHSRPYRRTLNPLAASLSPRLSVGSVPPAGEPPPSLFLPSFSPLSGATRLSSSSLSSQRSQSGFGYSDVFFSSGVAVASDPSQPAVPSPRRPSERKSVSSAPGSLFGYPQIYDPPCDKDTRPSDGSLLSMTSGDGLVREQTMGSALTMDQIYDGQPGDPQREHRARTGPALLFHPTLVTLPPSCAQVCLFCSWESLRLSADLRPALRQRHATLRRISAFDDQWRWLGEGADDGVCPHDGPDLRWAAWGPSKRAPSSHRSRPPLPLPCLAHSPHRSADERQEERSTEGGGMHLEFYVEIGRLVEIADEGEDQEGRGTAGGDRDEEAERGQSDWTLESVELRTRDP